MNLELQPHEVAAVVEALHDALLQRVKWSLMPGNPSHWRKLDFEIARSAIDLLASSYAKAIMLFRDLPNEEISPEFLVMFTIEREVWNEIDQITIADKWEDVKLHRHQTLTEGCVVCERIAAAS